jgi:tRNA(Ile)-lysidine synthase
VPAADRPLQPERSTGDTGLEVERRLQTVWPAPRWRNHSLIVAVSGGCDSVSLTRALVAVARQHQVPLARLVLAHFNHGWRGAASDANELFVRTLGQQLGVQVQVGRGALPTAKTTSSAGLGREGAARRERYAFLQQLAARQGARYVVTAHTADDQVETILFRLLRGTGVDGLAGIPRVRRLGPHVALIRPWLELRRPQLVDYLQTLNQPWCEDASNQDRQHARNRLRHELLPLLRRSFQPNVDEALLRVAADAREMQSWLRQAVEQVWPDCVAASQPDSVRFDRRQLANLSSALRRAVLRQAWRRQRWPTRDMSRRRWEELSQLVTDGRTTRRHFPGRVLVSVTPEWFTADREADRESS